MLGWQRQREMTFYQSNIRTQEFVQTILCVAFLPSKLYDVNNPDWTPSVKLGYESSSVGRAMVQSRPERGMKEH